MIMPFGEMMCVNNASCHGLLLTFSQADEFKPERMLDGKFEALPVGFVVFWDCTPINNVTCNSQMPGSPSGMERVDALAALLPGKKLSKRIFSSTTR